MYLEEDIHKYNVITHQGLNRTRCCLKFTAYNANSNLECILNPRIMYLKIIFWILKFFSFFMFDLKSRTKNTLKTAEL